MVIGVDEGIWVGLPLNFIVIIAGPSFFGDWGSEFVLGWSGVNDGRHLEALLPLSGRRRRRG